MARRIAQAEGRRRQRRRHLYFLDPSRGDRGPVGLVRPAQPAEVPRDVSGGRSKRAAAHRPLVPWRGAQWWLPRLAAEAGRRQGVRTAPGQSAVSRLRETALRADRPADQGTALEGRRTDHRRPVGKRIQRSDPAPDDAEANRPRGSLGCAALHLHGLGLGRSGAVWGNRSVFGFLCGRLLGPLAARRRIWRRAEFFRGAARQCGGDGHARGRSDRDSRSPVPAGGQRSLSQLHLRTRRRDDGELPPARFHGSRGHRISGPDQTRFRHESPGLLHVSRR